jgi:hypothetical protein
MNYVQGTRREPSLLPDRLSLGQLTGGRFCAIAVHRYRDFEQVHEKVPVNSIDRTSPSSADLLIPIPVLAIHSEAVRRIRIELAYPASALLVCR